MINIKPYIVKTLKKTGVTVREGEIANYDKSSFPFISYIEEGNEPSRYSKGKEISTYVRYKIDIWNKNSSTSDVAIKIDEEMSKIGLKRCMCLDVPDPTGLKHKLMRYEGVIDNNTFMMYKR